MLRATERPANAPSITSALSADGFAAPGAFLQPEPPPDSTARMRHLEEWHKGLTAHVKQLSVHHGVLSNLAEPLSEIYQLCHSALESSDHQNASGHRRAQRPAAPGSRAVDWMHSGDEADGGDTEPWGHDSRVDHLPHVSELKSKLRRGLEAHGQLCEDIKNLTDIKRTFHPLKGAQPHNNSPWTAAVHAIYNCARLIHEAASHTRRSTISRVLKTVCSGTGTGPRSMNSTLQTGNLKELLKTRLGTELTEKTGEDVWHTATRLKTLLSRILSNLNTTQDDDNLSKSSKLQGKSLPLILSSYIARVLAFVQSIRTLVQTILQRREESVSEFIDATSLLAGVRTEKVSVVGSDAWARVEPIIKRLLELLTLIRTDHLDTTSAEVGEPVEASNNDAEVDEPVEAGNNDAEVDEPVEAGNDAGVMLQDASSDKYYDEIASAIDEFEREKQITYEAVKDLLRPLSRPPLLLAAERVFADILTRHPHLKHPKLTLDVFIDSHRNSMFSQFTRLTGLDLSLTRRANGIKVTYASDWGRLSKQYRATIFMFENAYIRMQSDTLYIHCESASSGNQLGSMESGKYMLSGPSLDIQICNLVKLTEDSSLLLVLPSLKHLDEWNEHVLAERHSKKRAINNKAKKGSSSKRKKKKHADTTESDKAGGNETESNETESDEDNIASTIKFDKECKNLAHLFGFVGILKYIERNPLLLREALIEKNIKSEDDLTTKATRNVVTRALKDYNRTDGNVKKKEELIDQFVKIEVLLFKIQKSGLISHLNFLISDINRA